MNQSDRVASEHGSINFYGGSTSSRTGISEPQFAEVSRLHGLSPYIGKLAPYRAEQLVRDLSKAGQTVWDPFCGSGTVPLEAWRLGRTAIAGDLSPYAVALTRAKLSSIPSQADALRRLDHLEIRSNRRARQIDLRKVPRWIREFYHPETLREAIAWAQVLRSHREHFLFGCFLNLLHHQRPGFLSFPASHLTPYLRTSSFPVDEYPAMYEFRDVKSRLVSKVCRTLKEDFSLNDKIERHVAQARADRLPKTGSPVQAIITSPPYMSGLDYARDNRIRLWFCGHTEVAALEHNVSPRRTRFLALMESCFLKWSQCLLPTGFIAIVLGDMKEGSLRVDIPALIQDVAHRSAPNLTLLRMERQAFPQEKRVIKDKTGTAFETTLVFGGRKR